MADISNGSEEYIDFLFRSKENASYEELGVAELLWPSEDEREFCHGICVENSLNREAILQVNVQYNYYWISDILCNLLYSCTLYLCGIGLNISIFSFLVNITALAPIWCLMLIVVKMWFLCGKMHATRLASLLSLNKLMKSLFCCIDITIAFLSNALKCRKHIWFYTCPSFRRTLWS